MENYSEFELSEFARFEKLKKKGIFLGLGGIVVPLLGLAVSASSQNQVIQGAGMLVGLPSFFLLFLGIRAMYSAQIFNCPRCGGNFMKVRRRGEYVSSIELRSCQYCGLINPLAKIGVI